MDDRMTIGRFAEATGLSQRALRLYDEQGLLRPIEVDALTGYRFYHRSQLNRAEVIRTARMLNMPLAEIRALLSDDPPNAHDRLDRFWTALTDQVRTAREALGQLHRAIERKKPREGTTMDAFDQGNELYFHERNIEGALASYLEVPESDPHFVTARRYIGHNVYGREWSRWQEGLPYLEEAHRLAPDDPKVLEDIGRAYLALGQVEEGKRLLERAGTPVAQRALDRAAGGT
jgi:DNA-binding transcriptional MerR regulator